MPKPLIRAEQHLLATTPEIRADMARTVAHYRRVVRALATLILTHWPSIATAKSKCGAVEALCHATAKRPGVRYPVFARLFGQMPSYLRRAAIEAAYGVVSSYRSNYDNWLDDPDRARGARPPRLGFSNVNPSLYGGNMILEEPKLRAVRIKLLGADGQWCFTQPLTVRGRLKRLPHRLDLSPSLVLKGAKAMLVCPVTVTPPTFSKPKEVGRVCAVDVGINTALTAVVVSSTGTVIARTFLTCGRHDGCDADWLRSTSRSRGACAESGGQQLAALRPEGLRLRDVELQMLCHSQRDTLRERIEEKQAATGLPGRGFCRDLYRRIAGLSLDAARQLSSQLVAFARAHGAQAFVFEALKGWKPKGNHKVSRRRFHRFQHRALFNAVALRAEELGLRMLVVFAGGTSRWAYDGSGKLVRDPKNAQLATFASGKQYNADLNGAQNIAARGLALLYGIKNPRPAKAPGGDQRMPLVLSDVWTWVRSRRASLTATGVSLDAPTTAAVAA